MPTGYTLGLFKHITRPLYFCLVVDGFGVKYTHCKDTENLVEYLFKEYKCTTDWEDNIYLGIEIDFYCNKQTVDLAIPKYIPKVGQRLGHKDPENLRTHRIYTLHHSMERNHKWLATPLTHPCQISNAN